MADKTKKDVNKKAKAHIAAGWEWFKEAAWLQVLLLVGVVVGGVISVPYIAKAITSNLNGDNSGFYKAHKINYSRYQKLVSGQDKEAAGLLGTDTYDQTPIVDKRFSSNNEGFVVMFYKDNDSTATEMQKYLEKAYNKLQKMDAVNSKVKFYTLNVSWVPGDSSESSTAETSHDSIKYENTDITLEQQDAICKSLLERYKQQDSADFDPDKMYYSSDNLSKLDKDISDSIGDNATLPTVSFVTYSRTKGSTEAYQPYKVVLGNLSGISDTNETDLLNQLYDLTLIQRYRKS